MAVRLDRVAVDGEVADVREENDRTRLVSPGAGREGVAQSSIFLLGPFQVQHNGTPGTQLRLAKVQALLAYLAVEADRPHPRSELAGLLWPEHPQEQALRNLTQALVRLRQALPASEDSLLVTRQTVQWQSGAAAIDVLDFIRLSESSKLADLEQAAALYRGEFLAGFGVPDCEAFEEWLLLTRERLGHHALTVLSQLGEEYLAAGQPADAVAVAWRQLALDPWREAAFRQLMRALAQSGDRAGALAAYARCQTVLREELEITPDDETRLLAEQIGAGAVPVGDDRPVPATVRTHHLPAPLASFVGREEELAIVSRQLQEAGVRLVTVVGAGGSGKSRLALAAAWDLRPSFPDGVWWVELAGIGAGDDPSIERTTVASAVAAALGLTLDGRRPPLDELAAVLSERTALLVLDNCEHLPEVATIARTLLQAAPRLRLLATSREPLGLAGETLLPLEGLPVPVDGTHNAGAYAGVQLFLDRAARQTPGWGQDPAEVEAAGRLCRLLEGMPLGIELAAHWVGHYTPDEIAGAIQQDLDFLTARASDVPERQRSLQAVFAYSWNLLTAVEQQALARLSVFRGSVDRTAAQAVAAVVPTTLATLVDKSLLRRLEVGRYNLHELLRQFAAERLGEAGKAQMVGERHLGHYLALAEQAAPELEGPTQREWLERLDRDLDNLRAALTWAWEHDQIEQGLRLATALHRFWVVRGHWSEARRWLEGGLERAQGLAPEVHAHALWSLGALALESGEDARATRLLENAASRFEALGDQPGVTRTLIPQGIAAFRQGNYDQATAHLEEGLGLADELGNQQETALALLNLGILAVFQDHLPIARDRLEALLALERTRGDTRTLIMALTSLAHLSVLEGKLDEAETHSYTALALARELDFKGDIAYALLNLADVATIRGRYVQAEESLRESVLRARAMGDRYLLVGALGEHAKLAAARGQAERAVRLGGADARLREALGSALPVGERASRKRALERANVLLSEEGFRRAWEDGRAMTLDEAVAYALTEETSLVGGSVRRDPDAGG